MKSPWCFSLKQRFMEEGMEESAMAAGKRKQAARVGGLIWRGRVDEEDSQALLVLHLTKDSDRTRLTLTLRFGLGWVRFSLG
jgi:hypothetical protein